MLEAMQQRICAHYAPEEYPVLREQAARWSAPRPLAGLRVLDATPVFQNTIAKYIALLAAGCELTVGISEVMPTDGEVAGWLRQLGVPVVRPEDAAGDFDLVLDCAGAFSHVPAAIGYVELTRSGVGRYRNAGRPVFVADGGRIKRIETCLGTGESYFRAMAQLGYSDWKGKRIVIFGSGKVGLGLITYARRYGCHVTVVTRLQDVTPTVRKLADVILAADDAAGIGRAVKTAHAVVTATGVAGALARSCPARVLIDSDALIANMGVEDEFGPELPAERVLEGKRPLNFILTDPTQMKYIDATMALHNEGACWLAAHRDAAGLIEPPPELEEQLLEVCRTHGTIADELQYI